MRALNYTFLSFSLWMPVVEHHLKQLKFPLCFILVGMRTSASLAKVGQLRSCKIKISQYQTRLKMFQTPWGSEQFGWFLKCQLQKDFRVFCVMNVCVCVYVHVYVCFQKKFDCTRGI